LLQRRFEAQRPYRQLPWQAKRQSEMVFAASTGRASDFTTQDLVSSPFLIAPLLAESLSSAFGWLATIAESDGCRAARSGGRFTPLRYKRQQCSCCFY
jgi:hypothetical protein